MLAFGVRRNASSNGGDASRVGIEKGEIVEIVEKGSVLAL